MKKNNLKSITFGAMIIGLVGLLLYINRQFAGVIDLYLAWLIPLPIIVYSTKFDLRSTLIVCISMLLLAAIITTPATLFYVAMAEIAGFAYSYGLKKGKSSTFLICSVIIVSMFTTLMTMYVFAKFFGYNIAEQITYLQSLLEEYIKTISKYTDVDTNIFKEYFQSNIIMTVIVISDIISAILEGVIVHFFAYMVLRRLKMPLPPMKNLLEVRAPIFIKVYVVGAFAAQVMATLTKVSTYNEILIPVVIVAYVFAISFGYIIFSLLLTSLVRKPAVRKLIAFIVILLFPLTYQTLMIFGLFDMFTNMRLVLVNKIMEGASHNNEKQG